MVGKPWCSNVQCLLYKKDYFKNKKQNKKQNKRIVKTFNKKKRRPIISPTKIKTLIKKYTELNTTTFLAKKGNIKLNVYPRYFRY
jgi:hypothetical protein